MARDAAEYVKKSFLRLADDDIPTDEIVVNEGLVIPAPEDLLLGESRAMDMVILYADIRGYSDKTRISRERSIVKILNTFLTEMTRVAEDHGGTLGGFTGDRVMGIFPNAAKRKKPYIDAVECALMMQTVVLYSLNAFLKTLKYGQLACGIGIDAGRVLVSRLGPKNRNALVYVGDAANIAAKLSDRANPGETLMTRQVFINRPDYMTAPRGWTFRARPVLPGVQIIGTACTYRVQSPRPAAKPNPFPLLGTQISATRPIPPQAILSLFRPAASPPLTLEQQALLKILSGLRGP